jgi:hypothetical protein
MRRGTARRREERGGTARKLVGMSEGWESWVGESWAGERRRQGWHGQRKKDKGKRKIPDVGRKKNGVTRKRREMVGGER